MRLFPDFICDDLPYQRASNTIFFSHSNFLSPYPCVYLANPLGILHGDFVFANVASIVRRFFGRYPSAIFGSVMAIIVNTVQKMALGWRTTNGREKCQIRMHPCPANFNTSCAIIRVSLGIWVKTPNFHIYPSPIFFNFMLAFISTSFTMFFHEGILAL